MWKNVTIKYVIPKEPLKKLSYGSIQTIFGKMVLGYFIQDDQLHIAFLHFAGDRTIEYFSSDIRKHCAKTELIEDEKKTQDIFDAYMRKQKISVVLNGTTFQNDVWAALLKIPFGEERTYSEVAAMIGRPEAVRAVSNAIAKNDIALLVPCHRVKAKTGDKHKYRWGSKLKMMILEDEKRVEE